MTKEEFNDNLKDDMTQISFNSYLTQGQKKFLFKFYRKFSKDFRKAFDKKDLTKKEVLSIILGFIKALNACPIADKTPVKNFIKDSKLYSLVKGKVNGRF